MQIKIIYDNSTICEDFLAGWGFSCLVDGRVLFDTGETPRAIFHNLDRLNADVRQIEVVVISHDHWDHVGGLWAILEQRPGLPVYACPGFSVEFKQNVRQHGGRLIENNRYSELDQQIAVTGEIAAMYGGKPMPEQALILHISNGLVVITGCSHPGIIPILEKVRRDLPEKDISLVLGGFHLKDADPNTIQAIVAEMQEMGVHRVGPTHCTGEVAQVTFQKKFGHSFISVHAGLVLEI